MLIVYQGLLCIIDLSRLAFLFDLRETFPLPRNFHCLLFAPNRIEAIRQ
jgi:hypothetical protein